MDTITHISVTIYSQKLAESTQRLKTPYYYSYYYYYTILL